MTSASQLAANRENAQASTGPRTPEGKARSSQNAFTNGLASGRLMIPGEDPAVFDDLLAALTAEHQPATPTESLLVEELAKHHWLESRAQRLQAEAFAGFDGGSGANLPPAFLRLVRYETTHNRAFHKALATLAKSKKERAADPCPPTPAPRREAASEPPAILTPDSCLLTPPPTGFVSQNASHAPEPPAILTPDSCLLTPVSTPYVRPTPKIGRNETCPCGSGLKFKRCCLGKPNQPAVAA